MTVSSIGSTSSAAPQVVSTKKDTEGASPDSAPKAKTENTPAATVHISSAAQKLAQEATETAAQTAKEAASGDQQAQRLLKSEADKDHDGDGH